MESKSTQDQETSNEYSSSTSDSSEGTSAQGTEEVQAEATGEEQENSDLNFTAVVDGIQQLDGTITNVVETVETGNAEIDTLMSGLVAVNLYSLLVQLVIGGAVLALIFVTALRKL